jgi:hypothetical protein
MSKVIPNTQVSVLGPLAILVVGVVSLLSSLPTSASAHEFIIEGKGAGIEPEESMIWSSGVNRMEGEIEGHVVIIICEKDAKLPGGQIVREGCNLTLVEKGVLIVPSCIIHEGGRLSEELVGEIAGEGEYREKGKKAEETFAEFKIEAIGEKTEKCPLEGAYKIKGSETCVLPHTTVEADLHSLICSPLSSNLTVKGAKAESKVKRWDEELMILSTGRKWSID